MQSTQPWILFMHQDVYVPRGAGFQLQEILADLDRRGDFNVPLGFAGMQVDGQARVSMAGLVIDRTDLFFHGVSEQGISLDELAVVMHRSNPLRIDPALGWHLRATDLCLQSHFSAVPRNARIIDVPVFHNSLNDYTLSASFHASAAQLLRKYPNLNSVDTLCGRLSR